MKFLERSINLQLIIFHNVCRNIQRRNTEIQIRFIFPLLWFDFIQLHFSSLYSLGPNDHIWRNLVPESRAAIWKQSRNACHINICFIYWDLWFFLCTKNILRLEHVALLIWTVYLNSNIKQRGQTQKPKSKNCWVVELLSLAKM